ncbi:MAG: bifunctional polysaccharide deacetylase/glycosyltransferase family 2 protein [Pseudonocardia sp.]|nr:bifunctional polysaccharide deacetylase/glycosyltransferase family 2 protein [Pseudonocardia sp.]
MSRSRHVPKPSWVLVLVAFLTFGSILLLNGVVNAEFGNDAEGAGERGPDAAIPAVVTEGGSVLDATHDPVRTISYPAKTIALSFDDGPDPLWTPQILAVLKKHQVPGTFFVLGSQAAQYPQLVRDIRAQGSEIGLHTFTHPDLSRLSESRVERELTLTQFAVAGATGEITYLVRPPYSSRVDALDDEDYDVVQGLGKAGYITALTDFDSRDWERKGVESIVRASTPRDDAGGSLLLHDAGGERSQTVAALDRLIPQLKAQGWTFATTSGAVGLPSANHRATTFDVVAGNVLLAATAFSTGAVRVLEWCLLIVGGLVVLRLLLMLVVAGRQKRRTERQARDPNRPVYTRPVSVIVPAYNEKECIEQTVRSIAAGDHPVEIIVVDDGSTDGTSDIVERMAMPNVRLIRQPNSGKPAALNTGIAAARHEVIVMVDGDTVFETSTVRLLVQDMVDPQVGAVAGNAKVANRNSLVAKWQHIEYVMGFNLDRRVYDEWRCMATVPGAIGAFRKSALRQVGGVSEDTLAEDTDLTMALSRAGWRITYVEGSRAWTEAPGTFAELWRQRYRWSYGTIQSMWKHRSAVTAKGASGHFGRVGLLNIALFQVLLPLLAPLVDVFLIYGLFFLDPWVTLAAWGAVQVIQLLSAVYAFRLEKEKLGVLWLLPLQQIVYRQLMYAVLIRSMVTAITGIRLRWQKLRRTGDFGGAPAAVGPKPLPPSVEVYTGAFQAVRPGGAQGAGPARTGAPPRAVTPPGSFRR